MAALYRIMLVVFVICSVASPFPTPGEGDEGDEDEEGGGKDAPFPDASQDPFADAPEGTTTFNELTVSDAKNAPDQSGADLDTQNTDDELYKIEELILCDPAVKRETVLIVRSYPTEFFKAVEQCMEEMAPGSSFKYRPQRKYYCTMQKHVVETNVPEPALDLLKHPIEFSECMEKMMVKYQKILSEEEKILFNRAQSRGADLLKRIFTGAKEARKGAPFVLPPMEAPSPLPIRQQGKSQKESQGNSKKSDKEHKNDHKFKKEK